MSVRRGHPRNGEPESPLNRCYRAGGECEASSHARVCEPSWAPKQRPDPVQPWLQQQIPRPSAAFNGSPGWSTSTRSQTVPNVIIISSVSRTGTRQRSQIGCVAKARPASFAMRTATRMGPRTSPPMPPTAVPSLHQDGVAPRREHPTAVRLATARLGFRTRWLARWEIATRWDAFTPRVFTRSHPSLKAKSNES